jgi:hypothetical protein
MYRLQNYGIFIVSVASEGSILLLAIFLFGEAFLRKRAY